MTTVVVFHSVLGLRPAVLSTASRIEAAGHRVHVPDLYGGEVFDDMESAAAFFETIGPAGMIARTEAAVADLPADVVYLGFSNGGVSAEYLTLSRPGALGTVLMHAAMPPEGIGFPEWAAGVPVQMHYATDDPWRTPDGTTEVRKAVEAAGAEFTLFEYELTGHLFTDEGQPEFDQAASDLAHERVLAFLSRV